jgi:hypothetical protein
MAMTKTRAAAALLALSLAACGGGSSTASAPSDFRDVPGMICGDGSQTGIAISHGRSDAVLVYLSPGGACWSADECDVMFRSFSAQRYDLYRPFVVPGTVLDRSLAGNPFSDWTVVFIPYCTGDVHAGDSVQDYGGTAGRWQHHGLRNLQAAVGAFTAELARPARVAVVGSSAGGFGSLVAYDLVRGVWDPAGGTSAVLLDDSGPTLVGTAIASSLQTTWWDVWGLGSSIGAMCPDCAPDRQGDLSLAWDHLQAVHPQDRFGFVSTTQDATMIGFFHDPSLGVSAQSPTAYEANVDALATKLDGLGPRVATFRAGGDYRTEHALLADAYFLHGTQGPDLLRWVSQLVSFDPAWAPTSRP